MNDSKSVKLCCPADKNLRKKWLNDLEKEHEHVKKDSFEIAKKLKAFSNPIRLQIILMLDQRQHCMDEIARKLGIPKPALSYHLMLLKKQGLICVNKRSRFTFYSLTGEGKKIIVLLGKI